MVTGFSDVRVKCTIYGDQGGPSVDPILHVKLVKDTQPRDKRHSRDGAENHNSLCHKT